MWRKILAGALGGAICLFALSATVDAAAAKASGPKAQPSAAEEQDAPDYDGRKPTDHAKLDKELNERADNGGAGKSRAIVVMKRGCSAQDVDTDVAQLGGRKGRTLNLINGYVVELPNFVLRKLANNRCVAAIHRDRKTGGEMNRASVISGARAVQNALGYDGAGVGIAIIDSGIAGWHDDLTYLGSNPKVKVVAGQRLTHFVDFVNARTAAYDDNGHGSHVAGIIAGNGYDTRGARAGIAPGANLVSLKVLNERGGGYISNVIAALDWVVTNGASYNIRVVNLSVGAAVTQSYRTDPLTIAAKRVVEAGVIVVSAAGNIGKNPITGKVQYGAITAPGNAPWVLTVGAYSHMGTLRRADDTMASFSSRGPTARDYLAKPDVVAMGVGIVSLAAPGSTMYTTKAAYLLNGSIATAYKPYLSLSGTSMAAPIVTGTLALMLQANPGLTPNLAKAIIEYTAQNYGYDALTQGAGFLNTKGAVDLARFLYTAQPGQQYPTHRMWSKTFHWGNRRVKNGVIKPAGTAWATNVVWGASKTPAATNIVWGTACATVECDNIVWDTSALDADNVVWGTSLGEADNIVWGTVASELDNIVWGTACGAVECDNIVWGTSCGASDCFNIVWGTAALGLEAANVVWGTTLEADNIVWGTSGEVDNIVWGTSSEPDNTTWGLSGTATPLFDDPNVPSEFDGTVETFDGLFDPPPPTNTTTTQSPPPATEPTTTVTTTTTTTTTIGGGL